LGFHSPYSPEWKFPSRVRRSGMLSYIAYQYASTNTLNSTRRVLAYRVIVQLRKKDLVKITYYLRREEYEGVLDMARYLYNQKGIPRPTVGAYSRGAALKVYRDLNNLLAKEKEEADLKVQ
jgi:hypothetical protein